MGMGYCIEKDVFNQKTPAELELALANGEKLDDEGLLLIILARHHKTDFAAELAKELLTKFSTLSTVLDRPIEEIKSVVGISHRAVLDIKQMKHFLNAVSRIAVTNYPILDCYEKLVDFCKYQFGNTKKEQFHAILLNKSYELIHHECIQTGTLDHVTVYPRELLRLGIIHSASYLILAHNHPMGRAKPSKADIMMTRQLTTLAEGVGIGIIDHLILAGSESYSFLQHGMMQKPGQDLFGSKYPTRISNWA